MGLIGAQNILEEISHIFNGDETNFQLCSTTKRVLATKGRRNVYEIDRAPAKFNLTVMFTFSANGLLTEYIGNIWFKTKTLVPNKYKTY